MLRTCELKNVSRRADGAIIAQCPACAKAGGDRRGKHLIVYPDGGYGCVAYEGDKEHRQEIYRFVGEAKPRRRGPQKAACRQKAAGAQEAASPEASVARLRIRVPNYERIGQCGHSRILRMVDLHSIQRNAEGTKETTVTEGEGSTERSSEPSGVGSATDYPSASPHDATTNPPIQGAHGVPSE